MKKSCLVLIGLTVVLTVAFNWKNVPAQSPSDEVAEVTEVVLPSATVGDVNGDGLADIIFTDQGRVKLAMNQGTDFASAVVIGRVPFGAPSAPLSVRDVTGDGLSDVIVGTTVYKNLGKNKFETLQ